MYAAVICMLHYCSKDWGINVLRTCPPPRSELVLSPASIISYEDHYVYSPHAAFDDPRLCTVQLRCDFTLSTTTSWLCFYYFRNTVWRFHSIILRDSDDAFDNADCADVLQICRYPLIQFRRHSHGHIYRQILFLSFILCLCPTQLKLQKRSKQECECQIFAMWKPHVQQCIVQLQLQDKTRDCCIESCLTLLHSPTAVLTLSVPAVISTDIHD